MTDPARRRPPGRLLFRACRRVGPGRSHRRRGGAGIPLDAAGRWRWTPTPGFGCTSSSTSGQPVSWRSGWAWRPAGRPWWSTTSGTAAVELHPAVVEASHAGVPLIAATADRPPELHDVGAPQTVDQDGLYGSQPPLGGVTRAWRRWRRPAAGVRWRPGRSRRRRVAPAGPGPVHLNLAFRDPLLGTAPRPAASSPPVGTDGAPVA